MRKLVEEWFTCLKCMLPIEDERSLNNFNDVGEDEVVSSTKPWT